MALLNYKVFLIKRRGVLFLAALSLNVFQLASALDYESLVVEAMKSNPELKAHYNQYQASQKKMIQVRALPEPKLSYTRFLSQVQTRTGPQERILQLSQPFPWPGKLALRGGIANRDAEVAFHQYENLQRVVLTNLANYYYDYAILGEAIDITQQTVTYIDQLLPVVEEKVRGGGRLADTLLLEIEKEKIKDDIRSFLSLRPVLSSQLQTEMGREADLSESLSFPVLSKKEITLPAISTLESRLERHPSILAADSKVFSFKLKTELAAKAKLPDLSLGATVIDIGDRGDTAFGVVFGVSVPIRHRKYQAEFEQACLDKKASTQLRTSILNNLRSQLHREYQLTKNAQRRALLYRDNLLPKAEQTLEQLETSYRGDKTAIDEIIDAENTILKLRLECIKSSAEAQKRALYLRILTEPVTNKGIQAIPVINGR